MYHFFADEGQLTDGGKRIVITGDDYNHMVNVLRMKTGDEFSVSIKGEEPCDGTASADDPFASYREYRFGIESVTDGTLTGELRFVKDSAAELPSRIYLFQGLPKADKMELIIQKAVELGAYRIIPVSMKRSVVKLDEKKAANRVKRWNAISEAAAKQSKRSIVPEVMMPVGYRDALKLAADLDIKLLPYELAEGMEHTRDVLGRIQAGQSIGVFIGPEGGFADEEIEAAAAMGFDTITMGKRILRTETAGFTMLAWLMYALEGENVR